MESLSLDSLVPILKWSSQPYGSKWVHRQAMHFLCEEFSQVVTSDVLYELCKEHLLSAIQSDYLQVKKQNKTSSPGHERDTHDGDVGSHILPHARCMQPNETGFTPSC